MMLEKRLSRPAAAAASIPDCWKTGILVFGIARLFYSIWGAAIWWLELTHSTLAAPMYHGLRPILDGWEGALVGVWQRWDAVHYIRIVENGYGALELTAFFPLYPWLGGLLHRALGLDATLALLVISNLAFLLALVLLCEITAEQYPPGLARGAAAAAALFPTAVFFLAPYPLSLALMLVLLSYRSASRGSWVVSCLAGLAAGLCHSTVLPLAFLLAWEALRRLRSARGRLRWALLLVPASPLLGTGAFLAWRVWRGFPPFQALLAEEWGRAAQVPWQTLANLPELFRMEKFATVGWLNLALLAAAAALLAWGWKRLKPEHLIYTGALLISLLSMNVAGEPLSGFGRYLLPAFPLYVALAMLSRPPRARRLLFLLGLLLSFYTSGLFFMWVWLA